jgi:hypothetical protein
MNDQNKSNEQRLKEAVELLDRVLHQLDGKWACVYSKTTLHQDIQRFIRPGEPAVKTLLDEIAWADEETHVSALKETP